LEGVAILPEPVAESDEASPASDAPAPRLSPVDAARKVARPNEPRLELYEAIIATKWPRTTEAAKPVAAAVAEPEAAEEAEPAAKKDDGLGKFEDLLTPSDSEEQ
jgi:hypothetical protein